MYCSSCQEAKLQITVKLNVVLPVFAGLLLSGCSSTLHPTITLAPQNGGSSFEISGNGFSSGSPCATLSYVPPSGVTTIEKNVPCTGKQFSPVVAWTPAQIAGCTANTPATVLAVDHKTGAVASASVSILCEAALCPDSFTEASVTASPMPNYFTSGHSVSGGIYSAGPAELAKVWPQSSCFSGFTFELKSSEQSGGFEKCTYKAVKATSSSCTSIEKMQDLTLVFTCPDSGACR